jgi:hypothetical protein
MTTGATVLNSNNLGDPLCCAFGTILALSRTRATVRWDSGYVGVVLRKNLTTLPPTAVALRRLAWRQACEWHISGERRR